MSSNTQSVFKIIIQAFQTVSSNQDSPKVCKLILVDMSLIVFIYLFLLSRVLSSAYLLNRSGCLFCRQSHFLDFSDCFLMVSFNMFLCPSVSWECLINKSFIGFRLDFVYCHQEVHSVCDVKIDIGYKWYQLDPPFNKSLSEPFIKQFQYHM